MAALLLMLLAPVVSRIERKRKQRKVQAVEVVQREVSVVTPAAAKKESETEAAL